ncbi:MAG TPA: trigger factor [Candidatus Saccharimonadales bacterium]|nr:trigger factor [Candidatus Saccharimonadales bacterium]
MQYTVNRAPKGKIDIKIDAPAATFDEAYKTTLGTLSKDVSIAGFRPGMAPLDVVEKHVGVSKVLNDSASFLINKHLAEIFEKEKLFPIDSPKIAIATLGQGSPFSYTVSFVQKPEVKVGDWKAIKIKKIAAKEVTEADVLESIKNIYEAYKKQKSQSQNEESKSEEDAGKYIYDAQGNKIPIKDDGAANKTISADKIDDEFAKAIGARDLAHLREIVKKDLESLVGDQVEIKFEDEIFNKINEISTVEVPDLLIDDELNRILVRLTNQLEGQGRDLDTYLKEQNTTIDALKTKWREQAEKNVTTTLIMDEIGRAEQIKVAKEEVENAMKAVTEKNLSADQKADLERYIALSIFQAKTLDLVKKTITSV